MNCLQRARREIGGSAGEPTANTAEGFATAVTAVPARGFREELGTSIGSNGSACKGISDESEELRETFEERAAICEYDGNLTRASAEELARAELEGCTPGTCRALVHVFGEQVILCHLCRQFVVMPALDVPYDPCPFVCKDCGERGEINDRADANWANRSDILCQTGSILHGRAKPRSPI